MIAFATFGSRGGRIAVVRPDGSGLRYLTGKIAEPDPVLWFPGSRRLLFRRFADNALWVVDTHGGGLRRIAQLGNLADTAPAAIAPDGRRVVYSDVVAGYVDVIDRIYVVKADGSGRRNVGIGSVGGWSPDGRLLVFVNRSVYVVKADGVGRRKVAPKASDGGIGVVVAAWSTRNEIAYLDNADSCGGSSS